VRKISAPFVPICKLPEGLVIVLELLEFLQLLIEIHADMRTDMAATLSFG
jgi:hypothetical protein